LLKNWQVVIFKGYFMAATQGIPTVIKLICFLKRNPKLTRAEFHDHWTNVHGPLFANTPELSRYVARYEQNPRTAGDYKRDPETLPFDEQGFDGVTVMWYESMEQFYAMVEDPVYQAKVVPDEAHLLGAQPTDWIIAGEENVIIDKPNARKQASVKLICLLRRNAALGLETYRQHWLEHHGGLFQDVSNLNKDIGAYDQNCRLDVDYDIGPDRNYDGVTEQWFESLDRFHQSLSEPEQATMVEPDVAYMLDPTGTHLVMSDMPRIIIS
jgi:ribosomal protein L19E